MDEIAELLSAALGDLGHPAGVRRHGLPEASPGHINLVVAPQDYFGFSLAFGTPDADVLAAAAASVLVTTEQPGTAWFDRSLRYLAASPLTLDLHAQVAEQLVATGFPARHLHLGYHRSWDRWGGDPSKGRPVDIGFLGAMTDRRDLFFAAAASQLWDRQCDLRFFEISRPRREGAPGFLTGVDKWDWLAGTKVLLNVHRSDAPYFEWARVLEAAANGCVVISDPSVATDPFRSGEHFVEAPLDLLADYAIGLLSDREARTKMAAAAYELVRSELALTELLMPLIEEMATATQSLRRRRTARRGPHGLQTLLGRASRGRAVARHD